MSEEVMTIEEVAALLELAEKSVYAVANACGLPVLTNRGQWRIKRAELDK